MAADVLQRPVQSFLSSRDGGRDGAFLGSWNGDESNPRKSTIQCKFSEKPGATLSLAQLKSELSKAERLAKKSLAHEYVILTNAGVSGQSEADICAAFEAVGVGSCRVFDGGWIEARLQERPSLRMLAPRVYGIGDLTQILAHGAYQQAACMLSFLGPDLSCFVPTLAHRQAVAALNARSFVLLLGDPASGKSTIAATLALGALDQGCVGALRIARPDQLDQWHPGEKQVLWVDDAFGANQLDARRVQEWNAELPRLAAAVRAGSKVIFTSRSYIWKAARDHLKVDAFRPLQDSQVVINVQGLTPTERAQILYNHVKKGDQPSKFVRSLKPYLPDIATNPAFLPEIARRLGDPTFTQALKIDRKHLTDFVEHPVEFLKEVLRLLDAPSQAAIALIYLSDNGAVESPIPASDYLDLICELHDVRPGAVRTAMEHLNGSLTLLVQHPEGPRWTFRHPTISDAFTALVAQSPERIALYVHGAHLSKILVEAQCDSRSTSDGFVRIPPSFYPQVIERIGDERLHHGVMDFLARRCDGAFLKLFIAARPDVIEVGRRISIDMAYGSDIRLLHALWFEGLLPDTARQVAIAQIREIALAFFDSGFVVDGSIRELMGETEFAELEADYRSQWLENPEYTLERWRRDGDDMDDLHAHIADFLETLNRAQSHWKNSPELAENFAWLRFKIDEWLEEIGEDPQAAIKPTAPASNAPVDIRAIFDDVDA